MLQLTLNLKCSLRRQYGVKSLAPCALSSEHKALPILLSQKGCQWLPTTKVLQFPLALSLLSLTSHWWISLPKTLCFMPPHSIYFTACPTSSWALLCHHPPRTLRWRGLVISVFAMAPTCLYSSYMLSSLASSSNVKALISNCIAHSLVDSALGEKYQRKVAALSLRRVKSA